MDSGAIGNIMLYSLLIVTVICGSWVEVRRIGKSSEKEKQRTKKPSP
jgi:hypothetical protein